MKLADIPKFDSDLFTKDELAEYQKFLNQCVSARTHLTIEKAGDELDKRRAAHRIKVRVAAQRSQSINALYKVMVMEVPRRFDKAVVK